MLNALFYQKNPFLTQISKRSTHTDLHHPPLHLAQFFSLESLKMSSAYSKTSLGLKMEKFFQTICDAIKQNDSFCQKIQFFFFFFFDFLVMCIVHKPCRIGIMVQEICS